MGIKYLSTRSLVGRFNINERFAAAGCKGREKGEGGKKEKKKKKKKIHEYCASGRYLGKSAYSQSDQQIDPHFMVYTLYLVYVSFGVVVDT